MHITSRITAALAVSATLTIALAACSTQSSANETNDDGLRTVTVGALPIVGMGALWGAVDEGIFADHGIDLEVETIQGGSQAVPELLNGTIDVAIGQPLAPMRAGVQDEGIVIFSGYAASQESGADVNAVLVAPNSGITSPADLAGKRVAVNSTGDLGDMTIAQRVDTAGGDASSIEFVSMDMAAMGEQLDAGEIDAAWVSEPYLSNLAHAGNRVLFYPYQSVLPGLPVMVNFATEGFLETDAELAADYTAAMQEALEWAASNTDEVRAAAASNLGIDATTADTAILPTYSSDIDLEKLAELAQLAVDTGRLETMPDMNSIVRE